MTWKRTASYAFAIAMIVSLAPLGPLGATEDAAAKTCPPPDLGSITSSDPGTSAVDEVLAYAECQKDRCSWNGAYVDPKNGNVDSGLECSLTE